MQIFMDFFLFVLFCHYFFRNCHCVYALNAVFLHPNFVKKIFHVIGDSRNCEAAGVYCCTLAATFRIETLRRFSKTLNRRTSIITRSFESTVLVPK